jgi:hypothetical protein
MKRLVRVFALQVACVSLTLAGCAPYLPLAKGDRSVQSPTQEQPSPRPRSFSDPGPNYPDTGR